MTIRARSRRTQKHRRIMGLECLERRSLLATLTVNTTVDNNTRDNDLTYREALLVANGTLAFNTLLAAEQARITGTLNSGTAQAADLIAFAIDGTGVRTITPSTALPDITDPVVIDGTTQAGTDVNNLPNGSNAKLLIAAPVPMIVAGHSTVRGLVVTGGGLVLRGGSNLVEGCFIGTDATGTTAPSLAQGAAAQTGISIESDGNTVGGTTEAARNLISGNNQAGVHIKSGDSNRVIGNLIGTNAVGNTSLGNGVGVLVTDGSSNSIGGLTAPETNVVSGNAMTGIRLAAENPNTDVVINNLIAGNLIGLSAAGTTAVGNGNGVFVSAENTTIGGTAVGAGNVISGNPGGGVGIFNAKATLVQGNRIGTSYSGQLAVGNGDAGVVVGGGTNTSIGGSAAGARNVISGNNGHGISVNTPGAGTSILGNFIGVTADGVSRLGNTGAGVRVLDAGPGVAIGGTTDQALNVIYYNGGGGVVVIAGTGVNIRRNSIYGNQGPGIDLGGDGNTPNDAGDSDTGPNNRQNAPVITSVTSDGTTSTINGTLNAAANTAFTLQFFSNSFTDPDNLGEGQIYLGEANVQTDGAGNVTFLASVNAGVAPGQPVSAVAIDPQGNTSEFSANVPYTPDPAANLSVDVSSPVNGVPMGEQVTFTVTVSNLGPNTAANVSLVAGISPNATLVSHNVQQGSTSIITGNIEASLGSLVSGASKTLTIVLSAAGAGDLVVTGLVYSAAADPTPSNNFDSKVVTVSGPPDIATTAQAPQTSVVGGDVTIVFTVTNPGPATATNVVLTTDALPANTTLVDSDSSQGTLSTLNGVVTAQIGTLAANEHATVTIVLNATQLGPISYGATATLAQADPNINNNRAVAQLDIVTPADVTIEVTGHPNPVFVNQPIAFTIKVKNQGSTKATGVNVVATLTPGGTFISANPSQGTATPDSGIITAALGEIAPGGVATLVVLVTPASGGLAKIDAEVSADTDSNTSNNEASTSVVVNELPTSVFVRDVRPITNAGGIRGYVLTFSGPVVPSTAAQAAAYRIVANGRRVPIRRIGYDVLTHSVSLFTQRSLPANQFVSVGAHGNGPNAILAGGALPIDGDHDGLAGGEFFVTIARGRNLNYTDSSGDRVNLQLAGLGAMEVIRGLNGEALALILYHTTPARSTLRGSVRRGPRGQGEGVTRIPIAINLNTVTNRLPAGRFVVG